MAGLASMGPRLVERGKVEIGITKWTGKMLCFNGAALG